MNISVLILQIGQQRRKIIYLVSAVSYNTGCMEVNLKFTVDLIKTRCHPGSLKYLVLMKVRVK